MGWADTFKSYWNPSTRHESSGGAWTNAGLNYLTPGRQFFQNGGKNWWHDPAGQAWYDKRVKPLSDPSREAADFNSPFQEAIGREMVPTADNSILTRAGDEARSTYLGAGYNPAAAEQAARRARTKGWAGLTSVADSYWRQLQGFSGQAQNVRNQRPTTTDDNAFLGGFFG